MVFIMLINIARLLGSCDWIPMGSNLSFLRSKYGSNFQSHSLAHCIKVATIAVHVGSQSNCLIEQLRISLRTRCNEYDINGLTHQDII